MAEPKKVSVWTPDQDKWHINIKLCDRSEIETDIFATSYHNHGAAGIEFTPWTEDVIRTTHYINVNEWSSLTLVVVPPER